jgi:hypothetical protein
MTSLSPSRPSSAGRFLPLVGALVLGAAAVTVVVVVSRGRDAQSPAAVPAAAPMPAVQQLELVHAERFEVAQPYVHQWRAAPQPLVTNGWLLVLAGEPSSLVARQMKMPLLQVGAETAERVNVGDQSGKLVVLVPGDFALTDAPIFLGSPALPEEVGQPQLDAELATARANGAKATDAATVAKVSAPRREFANDYELRLRAIELVERFSPQEQDLIRGARVPLVK